MTFTNEEYKEFSDRAYWLDLNDKKKYSLDLTEGVIRDFGETKFKVRIRIGI